MRKNDTTSRAEQTDSSIKYDSDGNIIDFGGWESEEAKLRHNLTWTPEQILNWLEGVNSLNKKIRENPNVLRGNYRQVQ